MCGSISKAADQLFLSQPALSRQIIELEREFGVALFERRPSGVVATPAGVAMFRHAKTVLQLIDSSAEIAMTAGPVRETVDVGLAPGLPPNWIVGLVQGVHRDVQDALLKLTDAASSQQVRFVRDGRLDVAIIHGAPPPDLEGRLLRSDPFGVAIAPNRSFEAGRSIRWTELDGVDVLTHSRDQVSATHDQLAAAAAISDTHPLWQFANYTENATACALASGATVSLLTQSSASRLHPGWRWLPLVGPPVELETWLVRMLTNRAIVKNVSLAIVSYSDQQRHTETGPLA